MNTITLTYPETLPDSARLSRREFEDTMRWAEGSIFFHGRPVFVST